LALTERQRQLLIARLRAQNGIYAPPAADPTPAPAATQAEQNSGRGGFLGAVQKSLKFATSGEAAANALLPGDPGTAIRKQIERLPVVGKPLSWAADVATSPLTIATAGFGGALGAGIRAGSSAAKAGGFGRVVAPIVEPLVQGNIAARTGAAVAGSAGSELAANAAEAADLPVPIQIGASVLGGMAGVRTVANATANAAKTAGGMTTQQVAEALESGDPVRKFTAVLSTASKSRGELDLARSAELQKRTASIAEQLVGVTDPEARQAIIARGSQGALPTNMLEFSDDFAKVTADDVASLKQTVSDYYNNAGRVYEERRAGEALTKVLTGEIPQPNEIELLQRALGTEFAEVLTSVSGNKSKWQSVLDAAGIPRAVMSSFDLSMPFRQGAVGIRHKEYWTAWKPMVKALGDETYAKSVLDDIARDADPIVEVLRQKGIVTGLPTKGLLGREEQYMSGMAEYLPGVRQSQRAAVTFLNKTRVDQAKAIIRQHERAGVEITQKVLDDTADWVGLVTGRGAMPFADLETKLPQILSTLFFSPRFLTSRLQMLNPAMYARMSPIVRQEAMLDMLSYFGTGSLGLGALYVAGKSGVLPVDVEHDPRSTDFGKIQIGRTRIDPWAGFQPIARYAAQLISGQAKASSGEIKERDRAITLGNFARSKLAPVPGFAVDMIKGTTFTGEEVDVTSGNGMTQAVAERLIPLIAQDMAEAMKTEGFIGVVKTAPAIVGFGVQTYNSSAAIRNEGAKELYGKAWAELTGTEKAKVDEAYKEQLARQTPAGENTVGGFIDTLGVEARASEQQLVAALQSGQINNETFTKAMNELHEDRVKQIQGVMRYEGDDSAPTLLDEYFGLRDRATVNGIVDYQKLDQLQAEFMEGLSPDDRRVIDERTGFAHIPGVQWWVDAKKTISDSGYYKQQGAAMQRLGGLLRAVGGEGLTYNELLAKAGTSQDPREIAMLTAAIKRVDSLTRDFQKITRAKNPELDQALSLVYGSRPLALRR